MTRLKLSTLCALILGSLAGPALACGDRDAAVAAVQSGDFDTAIALQKQIAVDPACDDALRLWLDEQLARHYFGEAMQAPDDAAKQTLFQTSLDLFPHWRTYQALAELAGARGDHAEEARLLQAGINQMNDGPAHHGFSEQEAQAMLDHAAQAMLLSDEVVEPPSTRSGAPGGIFIESLRGFKPQEVTLAIEFEFDKTDFTYKGRQYADKLLAYLKDRQPGRIVLEGHTDPSGAEDYNMILSLQRAQALQRYLANNGYGGAIEVVGRGEEDVPAPPAGIAADSPEHYQLARRVVLVRN